jgi:DNA helicase-2/ATP-dependent DNA helicase PcrA
MAQVDVLAAARRFLVDRLEFLPFVDASFRWFDSVEAATPEKEEFVDYALERPIWDEIQRTTLAQFGREETTLFLFLQEMDLAPKLPPAPADAVRCLTIHGSKGLEFKHVYLIGLADEVLPSFQALRKGERSREVEEERRNCFVAITRTQETLTLTYSRQYFGWSKRPSRFLREMGLAP